MNGGDDPVGERKLRRRANSSALLANSGFLRMWEAHEN
jgi:hypothetical protein